MPTLVKNPQTNSTHQKFKTHLRFNGYMNGAQGPLCADLTQIEIQITIGE